MKRQARKLLHETLRLLNLRIHKYLPRGMVKFLKEQHGNKELIGVEVGAYEGVHALSILKELNIKKLYLIDYWDAFSEDYKKTHRVENQDISIEEMQKAEKIARKKLAPFKDKVVFLKGHSHEMISKIHEKVDFVYLDADKNPDVMKEDIKLYRKKLKENGIIGGHDIHNGFHVRQYDVVKTVFESFKPDEVLIDFEDWWTVKNKKAKDLSKSIQAST